MALDQKGAAKARILGFTLVELLVIIAVIGIMAGLVMSVIGNASRDANEVLARQQQVTLQEALNAWIANQSRSASTSINAVRASYNSMDTATRMSNVGNYLGGGTNDTNYPFYPFVVSENAIRSRALNSVSKQLTFSTWSSNGFPSIQISSQ